jgi:hypothetical protein
MVFNATFNNISVISWWSVLLVEEAGVPGENYRPTENHSQTLSHILYRINLRVRAHNVSGDVRFLASIVGHLISMYAVFGDTVGQSTRFVYYCV